MFSLSTFVSDFRDKIPSFLSFLPVSITGFIQKNIILSFLLCVSCIFAIEFLTNPVYVQGDSDAYNMQVFEWWPDLTSKVTYFWLLSENTIRKFLGVPQPVKKEKTQKDSDASMNWKQSWNTLFWSPGTGLVIDRSSIGDVWLYSKYLVFLKIWTIVLILLSAYTLWSRWGALLSFVTFIVFTGIDFWEKFFLRPEIQDIIDSRYYENNVLMHHVLFSERIFSIMIVFMLLLGIYYFFHSFKKKA